MKKIVSGLLMGILCVACAKQETTYTIQGEWKDGDGNVIYLKKDLGNKQYEILDSAVVVNGVFKMQKPLGDVDECILQINGVSNIIILDSVPIQVKCETVKKTVRGKETESVKTEISGSIEQDIFKTMMMAQRDEMLMMLGLSFMSRDEKTSAAMQDSLVMMYTAMKEKTVRTIDSLVANYPDCHTTALIINKFVIKDRDLAEVEKMYESLTPRIKNAYLGRKLKTSIDNIKKTSIGSMAPDFTLPAPDGKNVSLSDPNVKKVYDKFHDKGFEILSVSLDDKKDNWVNAIEKNDLDWGHVSSLKGWSCPVAKLYNVSGVPAMLLIDKEGKIVATKLRGDLLMEKVAEQFGE